MEPQIGGNLLWLVDSAQVFKTLTEVSILDRQVFKTLTEVSILHRQVFKTLTEVSILDRQVFKTLAEVFTLDGKNCEGAQLNTYNITSARI